jgi:glyoxylase-like metal-dependent hydrolase (beta-lactamase superfamily II)
LILSRAEPALSSLSDTEPYSHRGLTYVFGRHAPGLGELWAVAPGLRWARLPVPGSLKHVNVWIIEDGDGLVIVDTGLDIPACREGWKALISGPLAGKTVSRIIVTHFHPDHVGLAGWLCERFSAPLHMTREEWLFARLLSTDVRDVPPPEALTFWRMAGWSEERIEAEAAKGWGRFSAVVSSVPVSFIRMEDGKSLEIGGRRWRIVTGNGHSPEHACLIDEERRIMIAGDQVLPRITSNISLSLSEPHSDPLGDWLNSIQKLRAVPDDLLVLPSHGEPFRGLHARLDTLARGHADQLDALHAHLAQPRRAVECFRPLFGRLIDESSFSLATGEALAHLRHLEVIGRAIRDVHGASHLWRQSEMDRQTHNGTLCST